MSILQSIIRQEKLLSQVSHLGKTIFKNYHKQTQLALQAIQTIQDCKKKSLPKINKIPQQLQFNEMISTLSLLVCRVRQQYQNKMKINMKEYLQERNIRIKNSWNYLQKFTTILKEQFLYPLHQQFYKDPIQQQFKDSEIEQLVEGIENLKLSDKQNKNNIILCFDTQTTGFISKKHIDNLEKQPFMLQLSYIIYQTKTKTMVFKDHFIKIPQNVQIPYQAFKVHGISQKICAQKGIPLEQALNDFKQHACKANYVVAHNYQFDYAVINNECKRLQMQPFLMGIKTGFCTMRKGKQITNLKQKNGQAKNPKLIELYENYFEKSPKNLHNALHDCLVLIRCFMKMQFNEDIIDEKEFKDKLKLIQ